MSTAELPVVEVAAKDLPAFCPNPSMPVWNHHPRVFLDLGPRGEANSSGLVRRDTAPDLSDPSRPLQP